MFLGQYQPVFSAEAKRLSLPKRLRESLEGNEVVLSQGFEHCIYGFNSEGWRKESLKHLESPISDRQARSVRRWLFGFAHVVPIDPQGRIVIPTALSLWSQLKDEVVVVGAGDHFEIWSSAIWVKTARMLQNVKY